MNQPGDRSKLTVVTGTTWNYLGSTWELPGICLETTLDQPCHEKLSITGAAIDRERRDEEERERERDIEGEKERERDIEGEKVRK